jgi:hypothetical protein
MEDYTIVSPDARGEASMFARIDLSAGHLLLDEEPLLSVTSISDPTFARKVHALGSMSAALWSLVDVHTGAGPAQIQSEFRTLRHDGPDEAKTAEGIWLANNYTYSDIDDQEGEAVYPLRSRINHSCKPNSIGVYNQDTGRGEVRLASAVAAGEEISISYLALLCAGSCAQRRASLLETHLFECLCTACTHATVTRQTESDKRRVRIAELHALGDFGEDGEYFKDAVQVHSFHGCGTLFVPVLCVRLSLSVSVPQCFFFLPLFCLLAYYYVPLHSHSLLLPPIRSNPEFGGNDPPVRGGGFCDPFPRNFRASNSGYTS